MSYSCRQCGAGFDYNPDFDAPPEGEGHIEVVINPKNDLACEVTHFFCDADCFTEYAGLTGMTTGEEMSAVAQEDTDE